MTRTEPTRIRWTPLSDHDRQEVREAMDHVLASPQFCNSKRYPALLRYVVDQTLSGTAEQIKERTVGVEVFGRVPDYDTNADTVVRYTAGEVRKRLALYYHAAPSEPIQISLSPRSYLPEFYRVDETATASFPEVPATVLPEPLEIPRERDSLIALQQLQKTHRRILIWVSALLLGTVSVVAVMWGVHVHKAQPIHRFWSPVTQAKGPVVISAGSIMFSNDSKIGTIVADRPLINAYLSFENGLAMGRVAALLNAGDVDYRIQNAPETTIAQIRDSPVVLVGAYNNIWSQRLLEPLRFHLNARTDEAILDSWHPEKRWARDPSKPFTETPDYAIVARFRNPSTDSIVVVLAGLQRFGTDAASQFAVSSRLLDTFNRQVGYDWTDKNIEVVLRVDVVNGKAGAPMIEATHIW